MNSVVEEAGKVDPFRGKAERYGAGGNTLSNWRKSLHAAAVTTGGERSWISEAVSLSTTIIVPPHLGARPKIARTGGGDFLLGLRCRAEQLEAEWQGGGTFAVGQQAVAVLRFFYRKTLKRRYLLEDIPRPKL